MKQLDRLVIKEIIGPWVFGVGLFSALLFAGTYLGRITEFMVQGLPMGVVLQIVVLYMPAIFAQTFTMAMLLAALLGFGRLSSDSELIALRAAGASVFRIVQPVAIFSLAVAALTFGFNEKVVPAATSKSIELADSITKLKPSAGSQAFCQTVVKDSKLQMAIVARKVNPISQAFEGVTIITYDKQENEQMVLMCPRLNYKGGESWSIEGGARLFSVANPGYVVNITGNVWPDNVPTLSTSFGDFIKKELEKDQNAMTMSQLAEMIHRHEVKRDEEPKRIRDFKYWYWNKIALPLAAVIFGTLGAVLGIRNNRTGTASGFALAVAIIFGYVTLASFMNQFAMAGVIPAWLASFTPLGIGLVASGVIMWRRNS